MNRDVLLGCLVAVALAGCGGDDSASQAEDTVRDFAKATTESDGKTFCEDLVSRDYLEQTTGSKGDKATKLCVDQIDQSKGIKVKVTGIEKTTVDGDAATVSATLELGGQKRPQTFRLKKEDGRFKLVSSD